MSGPYGAVRILVLGLLCLIEGCAFLTLSEELTELQQIHVLTGTISDPVQSEKNTLIVLLRQTPEGLRVARSGILSTAVGQFVIEAPLGVFYLAVFEDLNKNLTWDEGEPIGYYGRPSEIVITHASPQTLSGFDIRISASTLYPAIFPGKLSVSFMDLRGSIVKIGQVIDWDDPFLSLEYGIKGYWEPLTFIREVGFCLYFLEAYDPSKIPVLFVHGAAGTPTGWKEIADRLDPQRFQPWLYYYPSGIQLDQVSRALNWMVLELQRKYQFRELYVVAHSMGGLVARSFILQNAYEGRQNVIRHFISISTPWDGHKMSAKGVEQAPTAVPSWRDMVPGSPFIRSLFQRPLPEFVWHDLFFSYRGDCSLFLENNDGTVELSSELDTRAQREAQRIYGYDEDHGSILTSEPVIHQINHLFLR